MTILLLLVLLFLVENLAAWLIVRRLEHRHAELWSGMGMPKAADLTLTQQWLAMTRFIYGGACLRVDDVPLNILCATIVMGEVAILYAMLFPGVN